MGCYASAVMLPFAIPGIVSLADTALKTWNRITETQAATKAQPTVDFLSLLQKASNVSGAGAVQNPAAANLANGQDFQSRFAALPEVKSVLSASTPGAQVNFSVSPEGNLYQTLPSGGQQQVSLSAESQALFRQWAVAGNSGTPMALTLTA